MSYTSVTILFYCIMLSMVAVGLVASDDSGFISKEALDRSNEEAASSRRLVDLPYAPQACPVRFEQVHSYGAVMRSCQGRHMAMGRCCAKFKAFACPYMDLMNDLSNGCADEMFFQLIQVGGLPRGIFSGHCSEGTKGLKCY